MVFTMVLTMVLTMAHFTLHPFQHLYCHGFHDAQRGLQGRARSLRHHFYLLWVITLVNSMG